MTSKAQKRWFLFLRVFAISLLCFVIFSGRHPPSYAQINAAADQRRDDGIAAVQKDVDANTATATKQWEAINAMSRTITQMQIDAAAGTSTNNKVAVGEIVALLTSLGFQFKGAAKKPSRRRRRPQDDDDEEEDD